MTGLGGRDPNQILREIRRVDELGAYSVTLYGDLRQDQLAKHVLPDLHRRPVRLSIRHELFWPASRNYVRGLKHCSSRFEVNISPESHDQNIRRDFGRYYDNKSLEETVETIVEERGYPTIFFMISLPGHTRYLIPLTTSSTCWNVLTLSV